MKHHARICSCRAALAAVGLFVFALPAFAAESPLWEAFARPSQETKPWTYWFWVNTLTDRETMREELADMAKLGFGGLLLTDSLGYWDDEEHIVNPPAEIAWGGVEWIDLIAFGIREAAKNGLKFSLNIAASGGHLRGNVDAGADNPKFLMCRSYLPGDAFEAPDIPHYRDVAVFAVRTQDAAARSDWRTAGDGYYSVAASVGTRLDGAKEFVARPALEVRELKSAADGAALGAGWTVVRFGAGTVRGQEKDIDVLDRTAVRRHLDRVIAPILAKVPGLVGRDKTFANLYNVSWEGAMPTWSATFEEDFAASEGFALRPFLPALAGFDCAGRETAAVMKSFRHARGVMMSRHLYGEVRAWAHEHGMGAFSESGGPWVRNPQTFGEADQLAFLAANDFPQGEFWPVSGKGFANGRDGHANANGRYITRGIASAAHAYGRRIASAEAFTHMHRHWSVDPAFLKPVGDQAFADGINLMVWHTYTTSPRRFGTPGFEYFAGSHINRNVTWHDDFRPMVAYLHRCQALLQRGEPITDVAALAGDRAYVGWGKPANGRLRNVVSDEIDVRVPKGYACDLVNDDALAQNPKLLSNYAVVYDCRKKENLGKTIPVGDLKPDVETASDYTWCHRRDGGEDIYFVVGEGPAELTFRAASPAVEVWDPVTGGRAKADATRLADGRTRVCVDLPAGGSAFVMFLKKGGADASPAADAAATRMTVAGPWNVSFAYHPGVAGIASEPPKPVVMDALVEWTTRDDLKHFAGEATYRAAFDWKGAEGVAAKLSLGEVPSGLAHVWLNGVDCGTVWCAPWTADVTKALRAGRNELVIRYVNNWYNRLVGDCALPESERVTKSVLRYWNKPRVGEEGWEARPTIYSGYSSSDPLQPSGLLGPVELVAWPLR